MVGAVPVGGDAPVTVQSMTITKTADVDGTLAQIYALAAAGADIVRCTCNEAEAAEGLAQIVPRSPRPVLVAHLLFYARGSVPVGRPFRVENGVVVALSTPFFYGPSRPFSSRALGIARGPFTVAVDREHED